MTRLLILVEGLTEEKFVKTTLSPYLSGFDVYCTAIPNTTSKPSASKKNTGGVTTWGKVEKNLANLFAGNKNDWVTTFLDFYKIPEDAPNYAASKQLASPLEQALSLQAGIKAQFPYTRKFIPFITLHEFEALLFSDVAVLATYFSENPQADAQLTKVMDEVAGNPEHINHGKSTHPCARLNASFPGYEKNKASHGPVLAEKIGIEKIQQSCPHFAAWVRQLCELGK